MSQELEDLKKKIHAKNFNISRLINKFKKEQRASKAIHEVPEEVLISVCKEILYRLKHQEIQHHWPYFMKVLNMKLHEYNAMQNQKEAKAFQFTKQMPQLIKNLFCQQK